MSYQRLGAYLLCLAAIIYWPSFHAPFQYDSVTLIHILPKNPLWDIPKIWQWDPSRFFPHLTFTINYYFFRTDEFSYHLVNFFIHLGVALIVYFFVREILRTGRQINGKDSLIATAVALVFLVHPIQTSAVSYVVQRSALLATLCYYSSMHFYLISRLRSSKRHYTISLLAAYLGALCKPIIVTLPLSLFLLEGCFLQKNPKPIKEILRKIFPFLLILPLVRFLLILLQQGQVSFGHLFSLPHETRAYSVQEYFLTQLNVLMTYLRLLFAPFHQNLDYDYPLSQGFLSYPTYFSFLMLSMIAFFAVKIYRRIPLITFCIFFFFISLSVESSFFPIKDLIFEHRLYLPMLSFATFIVVILQRILKTDKSFVMAMASLLIFLGVLTYQRNLLWSDRIAFLKDVAEKSPLKARSHLSLGLAYADEKDYGHAIGAYSQALLLNPRYLDAHENRGIAYLALKKIDLALRDFDTAIGIDPNFHETYLYRSAAYYQKKQIEKSIEDLNKAILLNARYAQAYFNRSEIYRNQGKYDNALRDLAQAIEIVPYHADAYNNRGIILAEKGLLLLALQDFNNAVGIDPGNGNYYSNRGIIYLKLNQMKNAEEDFKRATKLNQGKL